LIDAVDVRSVGIVLQEFGPNGSRTIGISADPRLIRTVAGAMAVAYRGQIGAPGTPSETIDKARISVLDSIAGADFTEEAEGEQIAKPVWWDTLDNNEEVPQSQP
jgi:hypothetical protein